ncbi:hypothetical protein B0A62_13785 [Flavobacterium hydatis]|uniref:Uncharacterized protein n=2 Tax=Flavobacterium hydatis TaxID=991 RepID=A0A086A040_FLAHY|nr:hypothetical protein IW20_21500 [Flavobacterium hydatis]OXA93313.1 hypothetical protein B0A62_13785 [Flavobacterium hydatis]
MYLVISDDYFHKMDFKPEGFKVKIEEYLLFTFNIPLILMIIFSIILIIKVDSKINKLIIFLSSLVGIMTFIVVDNIIKKILFYPENVLMGLITVLIAYVALYFIILKAEKKLVVDKFKLSNSNISKW